MRTGKMLAWVCGSILALLVVAGGVLWLGGSRIAVWALEHPVSAMIGRQIRVDGPLRLVWGAPARIVIEDIHVANASWSNQPEMFAARHLEIDLFPISLQFGPARIPLIAVEDSRLLLETSPAGDHNWDFAKLTRRSIARNSPSWRSSPSRAASSSSITASPTRRAISASRRWRWRSPTRRAR